MIDVRLKGRHIILASESPRRQYLLKELGFDFEIFAMHLEETYPAGLTPVQIACYLAEMKANSFDTARLDKNSIILTADTIVSIGDEILGKPRNHSEAVDMLKKLSGCRHEVITAVCLKSKQKTRIFYVLTSVTFKELTNEEINYYIENFRPFDKAGGYGVQEWIGYIGITNIDGSFFNVMGLPVRELYEELLAF
jgi:septum formation protein